MIKAIRLIPDDNIPRSTGKERKKKKTEIFIRTYNYVVYIYIYIIRCDKDMAKNAISIDGG